MFDVAWTEPVETVGQRKTRKGKNSIKLSQGSSVISSESSDASTSPTQARPSLLGILSDKKGVLQRTGSSSMKATTQSESTTKASKRISTYTTASDSSSQESSGANPVTTITDSCSNDGRQSSTDTDISSPSDVFSRLNARASATTDSSWGSAFSMQKAEAVQSLSRDSYITQSTEVTISPRDSVNEGEQIATVVRISSAGTVPIKINNSSHPYLSPATSIFDFPIPKSNLAEESTVLSRRTENIERDIVLRPKAPPADSWRPPEAWQCPSVKVEEVILSPPKPSRRIKERKRLPRPSELTHSSISIRKMNVASPKIMLERLKEEWVGVADASIYRELELEKQLWMLAALKTLGVDNVPTNSGEDIMGESALTSKKILSLYENKASSSFLSASNPTLEVHHLSTLPLTPKYYPNVHPLAIPGPSAHLPYASNIFASIHAFSLPTLLPASSIPALLRDCQRTLTSSSKPSSSVISPAKAGSLHLTILDPSPIASTLGPLLRAWLDTHLIVNLERQFRCINPARLFPIWLADAGLRAEGSTISNVRFLASMSHVADGFSMIDKAGQEQSVVNAESTKQELKNMVGRMLWKEMWGPFVEGEKWWWEDEKVIEECERVGTCWEYAIIEAVKEG